MSHDPRGRHRIWRALGAAVGILALAAAATPARASRPVEVYQVTVQAGSPAVAVDEAMRRVLVRATGRLDAPLDPALAPLVAGAAQFVLSAHPAGAGSFQVTFDGPRIEQRIVAAHDSVWGSNRPFTIVVLSPPPTGMVDEAVRESLENFAAARGLPTALVPLAVTDSSGNALSNAALLASAQSLGGDDVLIGRASTAAPSGGWNWTLITGISTLSWSGTLGDGINHAADALARVEGGSLPLAVEAVEVEVSGITTLADYAAVEQMLAAVPGSRRSGIVAAEGDTATFEVLVRGGAQAIAHALAHAPRLVPAASTGASLAYRIEP